MSPSSRLTSRPLIHSANGYLHHSACIFRRIWYTSSLIPSRLVWGVRTSSYSDFSQQPGFLPTRGKDAGLPGSRLPQKVHKYEKF